MFDVLTKRRNEIELAAAAKTAAVPSSPVVPFTTKDAHLHVCADNTSLLIEPSAISGALENVEESDKVSVTGIGTGMEMVPLKQTDRGTV